MTRIIQMALLSLVLLAAASLHAQEPAPPAPVPAAPVGGMVIGGDAEMALPVGNFDDAAGLGFGLLGRFEYVLNPQLDLTGRLGLIYFLPKSENRFDAKYWTIPILFGAKYNLNPDLYLAGELGLFSNHFTVDDPLVGSESISETDFGLTAGAGYRLDNLDFRLTLQIVNLGHVADSLSIVACFGYTFWKR